MTKEEGIYATPLPLFGVGQVTYFGQRDIKECDMGRHLKVCACGAGCVSLLLESSYPKKLRLTS